ncbi:protein crumbs homolog 3a isoform X2 [Hippocampus zosterae]|uniref:protein crumbs homolog 3a isoform X2 n=1 Tax=Hippocampus zosterae TaxID=109293 RepID=UPI00223E04CB|nr:protein crumbs homolog 3a isoform X2 [Hippocampus zosterae]XP_051904934.1 protein crumbs homolog 3a isoform X2 [Hippocampus zosterae]XP_051904935.1 protein crumbs homolog 3a isoform X2 [Hippocampus zosterae]XP_051904936.1 protein crumbs homolog 3a isoform X2 [Hippocampus zosterae]XP_051904937.1 protein crumbs homolog 3a isoform X2 [Hippocampus zosterae]
MPARPSPCSYSWPDSRNGPVALHVQPRAGNNTVSRDFRSQNATGTNIAAIVAPTVTLGLLAIIALAVAGWLLCVVKKKRQTEGAYRPSAEEQCGTRSVATTDILKLPKEERLI